MNIWLSSLRIRAHLSWRTGKHLHVLHMLRTYSTCSYPGYQDTTIYAALTHHFQYQNDLTICSANKELFYFDNSLKKYLCWLIHFGFEYQEEKQLKNTLYKYKFEVLSCMLRPTQDVAQYRILKHALKWLKSTKSELKTQISRPSAQTRAARIKYPGI